jgi:mgtE-like transporter
MKLANLWRYFSKDAIPLKFLKEAIIGLCFNVGGILAGFIVASQFNVFQLSPWTLAVYPAVLTARGVVSGLFSGRLSTALNLGTIYPRLRGNTEEFYRLFESIIFLSLETSVIMSLFSIVIGSVFWGIILLDFFDVLIVVVATMFLGLINSVFTIFFAFASSKKGLDADVLVYPIMSTTADVTVTLCYVVTLNLFFLFGFVGKSLVISLGIFLAMLASAFSLKGIHDATFTKTVKESFFTVIFVALIVTITGTMLRDVDKIVGNRKEIYTVYPALIDTVGDVGAVVGSTATTDLALGLFAPSLRSILSHSKRILATWAASILMFTLYTIISLLAQGLLTLHTFLSFVAQLVTTNLIAVSTIICVSFAVAILTHRRGFNPDNFVIPIETSFADSVTTLALLVALVLVN